jgi:hypothetical protein
MKPQQHHTSTYHALGGFIARCSCGWASRPQPTEREAENEATDHVVAVTRAEL